MKKRRFKEIAEDIEEYLENEEQAEMKRQRLRENLPATRETSEKSESEDDSSSTVSKPADHGELSSDKCNSRSGKLRSD